MVVFSRFSVLTRSTCNNMSIRTMSGPRTFDIKPSNFASKKFFDFFQFYLMLGLIPCGMIILYANIFIGPATLTENPDCTPEYWEYYRHPITRFLAKNLYKDPQQDYEKMLHHLFEEKERQMLRKLGKQVNTLIGLRNDYQAYYYRPIMAKYQRCVKEAADFCNELK